MITQLDWLLLTDHREDDRLHIFFKIEKKLVLHGWSFYLRTDKSEVV